jgi:hypothetical protein
MNGFKMFIIGNMIIVSLHVWGAYFQKHASVSSMTRIILWLHNNDQYKIETERVGPKQNSTATIFIQ